MQTTDNNADDNATDDDADDDADVNADNNNVMQTTDDDTDAMQCRQWTSMLTMTPPPR